MSEKTRVKLEDGREGWRYGNGDIRNDKGQVMRLREGARFGDPGLEPARLQAQAAERREEEARAAVREALKRGDEITWDMGWQRVAAVMLDIVYGGGKDGDKIRAVKVLAEMAGIDGKAGRAAAGSAAGTGAAAGSGVVLGADALDRLAAGLVALERERAAIDVTPAEGGGQGGGDGLPTDEG